MTSSTVMTFLCGLIRDHNSPSVAGPECSRNRIRSSRVSGGDRAARSSLSIRLNIRDLSDVVASARPTATRCLIDGTRRLDPSCAEIGKSRREDRPHSSEIRTTPARQRWEVSRLFDEISSTSHTSPGIGSAFAAAISSRGRLDINRTSLGSVSVCSIVATRCLMRIGSVAGSPASRLD